LFFRFHFDLKEQNIHFFQYVKYLYAIIPDRKSMMISVDELSELVENSEIEVAKQLRGQ